MIDEGPSVHRKGGSAMSGAVNVFAFAIVIYVLLVIIMRTGILN